MPIFGWGNSDSDDEFMDLEDHERLEAARAFLETMNKLYRGQIWHNAVDRDLYLTVDYRGQHRRIEVDVEDGTILLRIKLASAVQSISLELDDPMEVEAIFRHADEFNRFMRSDDRWSPDTIYVPIDERAYFDATPKSEGLANDLLAGPNRQSVVNLIEALEDRELHSVATHDDTWTVWFDNNIRDVDPYEVMKVGDDILQLSQFLMRE